MSIIIETFKQYQGLALRTYAPATEGHTNLEHSAMGLNTEVGELVDIFKRHFFYKKEIDLVNLKEEIGDVLWYVALGYFALSRDMPESVKELVIALTPTALLRAMQRSTSNFYTFGIWEKDWVPGSEEQEGLAHDLDSILFFLSQLAKLHNFTLMECAEANIIKLAKRYPDGFTEFHALNRDTENEISHMEIITDLSKGLEPVFTPEYIRTEIPTYQSYDTSLEAKQAWVDEGEPAGELGRPAKRVTKKKVAK